MGSPSLLLMPNSTSVMFLRSACQVSPAGSHVDDPTDTSVCAIRVVQSSLVIQKGVHIGDGPITS